VRLPGGPRQGYLPQAQGGPRHRCEGQLATVQIKALIYSPAHKRTEGRAPLWCSEFTTKAATLQGDSEHFAAGVKQNLRDLRAWWSSHPLWNS
jgi:hypothetical protein